MPIMSHEAIEAEADYTSGLEAEIQSYLEELAEVKAERDALKVEITRMMVDRQLAV